MKTLFYFLLYCCVLLLLACPGLDSDSSSTNNYISTNWQDAVIDPVYFEFNTIGYRDDQTLSPPNNSYINIYHVNPVAGDPDGDGSEANPWRTLEQVMANHIRTYSDSDRTVIRNPSGTVQAGDLILLYTGDHGSIAVNDMYNTDYITIKAASGERPLLKNISMRRVGYWRFDGLYITTEMNNDKNIGNRRFFDVYSERPAVGNHIYSDHIDVFNCKVYSVWNSTGWTVNDWNTLAHDGISVAAEESNIQNNFLINVRCGIQLDSLDSAFGTIKNNTIANFSWDGINAYSDNTIIEANLIKDSYVDRWDEWAGDPEGNHDDGIQTLPGWRASDNIIHDVIISRNVIINTASAARPHKSMLQGIWCSDGLIDNWLVEKNLVLIYGSGIGLYLNGSTNSTIRNNIVLEQTPGDTSIGWLIAGIGCEESVNTIEDNYSHSSPSQDNNIRIFHQNIVYPGGEIPDITVYDIFEDYDNYDFRLKAPYDLILEP